MDGTVRVSETRFTDAGPRRPGDPGLWTPSLVIARLETAAFVFGGIPINQLSNVATMALQVDVVRGQWDSVSADRAPLTIKPLATPQQIDQADRALGWFAWVAEPLDRAVLWGRAHGVRWRNLERRLRLCERQLRRRHRGAVMAIVVRLNA